MVWRERVPARLLVVCLLLTGLACGGDDDETSSTDWTVTSPDRHVVVEAALVDLGGTADYPAGERLYYRVERDGIEVLQWSPLGVVLDDADFSGALEFRGKMGRRVDVAYETAVGKRRMRREYANESTLRFANADGREIEVVLRAAADGAAYRYRILGDGQATVTGETSGFRLPEGSEAWLIPYSNPSPFTPAYERTYEKVAAGAANPDNGWGLTGLFRIPDSETFVLMAESDLDRTYSGTHLSQPVGTLYRVAFPAEGEGRGVGEVEPTSPLPWTTPWRVAIVGDLATVFESTLVDDLSSPTAEVFGGDASWVVPGRSAWSWFTQGTGDPALQREYVDFAAELGWEYVLVDARWDQWPNGEDDARDVIDYAADAGVGVLLWYNSGGEHNIIATETPRDRMGDAATRRAELAKIADWGVRGIKVDFFQSEKQDRITQYVDIMEDAAREQLLVNFHGCTLPRGWQRTYPNLVTMEAVRGAESYQLFDGPDAIDNVRLAFTRNVIGSMDYTPVTFAAALAKQAIPYAHQVALAVVFESGVQHFADRADANPNRGFRAVFAEAPFLADFFADVPTVWDETKLVEGSPDSHIVVARRHGESWYLGGLNGLETELDLALPLDFIEAGHEMRLVRSQGADGIVMEERTVEPGEMVSIRLEAKDGFAATLEPR